VRKALCATSSLGVRMNTHMYIRLFCLNYQILRKQLKKLFLSGWIKMYSKLIVKFGMSFYSSRLLVLEFYYTNIKRKEIPAHCMLIVPSKKTPYIQNTSQFKSVPIFRLQLFIKCDTDHNKQSYFVRTVYYVII